MKIGEMLKEFHDKFQIPGIGFRNIKWEELNKPEVAEAGILRYTLVQEEFREFRQAIIDAEKDINNKKLQADVLKEICDCIYVLAGFAEKFGFDIDTAFERVHASNMSKVDDNGKPVYREDGKLLKGLNYKAPDLLDLVSPEVTVEEVKLDENA